ncbi:TIR domain-containing protein [Desulfoluna spongiiphila]|uniref:TIR domain-containing protein n=1 Tax=Desulfoluna spongiiphila TaxID=419481 RepID=UPI001C317429|nr:TIR domain-containing protein [Desulfoluna spongiiphila]
MSSNEMKNVFISHFGKDDDSVQSLKKMLKSNGCILRNSSIDSTKPNDAKNPKYIEGLLRNGIRWAGSTVVLIGPETHKRKWVDWEIEQANKHGKPIIGVFIQGAKDSDIPENFQKYGDALVGWNSGKIIDAINGNCNDFVSTDGKPWKSKYSIERSTC